MGATQSAPERWAQIKKVLNAALDLADSERSHYLLDACGTDSALRSEVESLLAAHNKSANFMEIPALASIAPDKLERGDRVGQYQIVQLIGEGGMGSVYQALREDIHKLVALKVVKRSLHPEFILSRFEWERQILGHFDHPNITKFLDSGVMNDGRPYFVMEFIGGEPIDEFCDQHRLTIRQRLELFLKVCAGVEYAHRNLVVHRDLKPRNILVDTEGNPKLLDFGIAKILEEDPATGTASATITMVHMMTPEYASPEQARGGTVTTASDVYSLGVLLFELLTGHRPYRLKNRMPHEVAAVICAHDPPKPSAIVRRIEDDATPESVGAAREVRPSKLARTLSGDLDNIVLKALDKEPTRRYGSVEHLADDIRRHLDGLPVTARPASFQYRAGKFIKRHRAGVFAAALVVLSLLTGLAATMREARIAGAQRARAERRFQDVRSLANSLMFEVHDAIATLPGSTPARELLVNRALKYLDSLASEASGDPSLQRELASAYEKVGDVQGGFRSANLGNFQGAMASYSKALAIRESLDSADGFDPVLKRELITNHGKLGDLLSSNGNAREAMQHSLRLLSLAALLADRNPNSVEDQRNLASAYIDVGSKQADEGDWPIGIENCRRSVALFEKLAATNPNDAGIQRRLAIAYERTGSAIAANTDQFAEALKLHRQELALAVKLAAGSPTNTMALRMAAFARSAVAGDLTLMNDWQSALPLYSKSLDELKALAAADPKSTQFKVDVAYLESLTGQARIQTGSVSQGVVDLNNSMTALETLPSSSNTAVLRATNLFWLGHANLRQGRQAEARSSYAKSLEQLTAAKDKGLLHGRELKMIEQARDGLSETRN